MITETERDHAERFVVGARLQNDRVQIDPTSFYDERCQTAYIACGVLQQRGYFYLAASSSPDDRMQAAAANVAVTAAAMQQTGLWELQASDPVWFLQTCVESCTLAANADYHARVVHHTALERQTLADAEHISQLVKNGRLDEARALLVGVQA